MEKTVSQKIKLGVFVITGSILLLLIFYLIGQKQNMFSKTFTVHAVFNNVSGLQLGNNVRYSGINVGTVQAIDMLNDSTVTISMNIQEKIQPHIKKSAIASIGSDGLVGSMVVNIVPGEKKSPLVKHNDTINSFSKIGADDMLSTLSVTNENAALLTSDLLKITNSIINGKGSLGLLLNDTVVANNIRQTIIHLKQVTIEAQTTIKALNTSMHKLQDNNNVVGVLLNDTTSAKQIKSVINNLHTASNGLDSVVANLNQFTYNIKEGKGAIHYLSNDTIFVKNLQETMININESSSRLNENMEALKHNFLFRRYFKKQERKARKENIDK